MEVMAYASPVLFFASSLLLAVMCTVVIRMGNAIADGTVKGRPEVRVWKLLKPIPVVVLAIGVIAFALVAFWYLPFAFAVAATGLAAVFVYLLDALP